jgi:hypothetical protein
MGCAVQAQTAEYPWWQTSCEIYGARANRIVAVIFRQFPVDDAKVDTDEGRRFIQFDKNGVRVGLGAQRFGIHASSIASITVRSVGARNYALAVTMTTSEGVISDGPIGVIELPCWRDIETLVSQYPSTIVLGSPPRAAIPLHDANGNYVPDH